jgi:hypothetical protein
VDFVETLPTGRGAVKFAWVWHPGRLDSRAIL